MGLPLLWIQHLNPQDTEACRKFEEAVRSSTLVLGRLKEILEDEERKLDRSEASETQYDSPAWTHLQAHRNGDRSRLRKILSLLEFMDQK